MKTDEMLIREVASAICRAEGKEPASAGMKSTGIKSSGRGLTGIEWNEFMWQDYIKQAEAAIETVRSWNSWSQNHEI